MPRQNGRSYWREHCVKLGPQKGDFSVDKLERKLPAYRDLLVNVLGLNGEAGIVSPKTT